MKAVNELCPYLFTRWQTTVLLTITIDETYTRAITKCTALRSTYHCPLAFSLSWQYIEN